MPPPPPPPGSGDTKAPEEEPKEEVAPPTGTAAALVAEPISEVDVHKTSEVEVVVETKSSDVKAKGGAEVVKEASVPEASSVPAPRWRLLQDL